MDVSSISNLCVQLISSAFQRCRLSENLCRLSVSLDCSPDIEPPIVRISISDTGIGSCVEEFQDLTYGDEFGAAKNWDGLLFVKTTSFNDDEVYNYQINIKDNISSRGLTRLSPQTKNGVKFSGTEVHLSVTESPLALLTEMTRFYQKILILNIPNVTMDLMVKQGALVSSPYENVFLAKDGIISCSSDSNVERLQSGFEDYVLKHGNNLNDKCDSCFASSEHLKVGSSEACGSASHKNAEMKLEAVIVISELSESSSLCCKSCNGKTQVLYFKDFSPSPIPQSLLSALTSIDWKAYGLTLVSATDQDGVASLQWENFPPNAQIDILLHCYHSQTRKSQTRQKAQPGMNLMKKAVKSAVDDLKEKHEGFLLSSHARKICSYVPDLARTLAGLVFSSNDSDFQKECFSILGLQSQEVGDDEVVENCIMEKLISVIGKNDRKPRRTQHEAATSSLLFLNDGAADNTCFDDDDELEEGESFFTFRD